MGRVRLGCSLCPGLAPRQAELRTKLFLFSLLRLFLAPGVEEVSRLAAECIILSLPGNGTQQKWGGRPLARVDRSLSWSPSFILGVPWPGWGCPLGELRGNLNF